MNMIEVSKIYFDLKRKQVSLLKHKYPKLKELERLLVMRKTPLIQQVGY